MRHKFERYCKDYTNIENYEKAKADNFKCWDCHHRLETHNSDGERRAVDITHKELKALGTYYNRPASELIFLTESEHRSLHKPSEEAKMKISAAMKGRKFSEETLNKMSTAKKGNTYVRGRRWFNNGKINKFCYKCPDGFVPGRLLINKGE